VSFTGLVHNVYDAFAGLDNWLISPNDRALSVLSLGCVMSCPKFCRRYFGFFSSVQALYNQQFQLRSCIGICEVLYCICCSYSHFGLCIRTYHWEASIVDQLAII
jgi:hypothetical protein